MKYATHITTTICMLLLSAIGMAQTTPEPRQSLTSQGSDITRGSVVDGNISYDEFEALQTTGTAVERHALSPTEAR